VTTPPTSQKPQHNGPTPPTSAPLNNEIGIIFGRKGSGKTTLARHIAARCKRVIILDTLGTDYGGGVVVTTPTDLRAYFAQVREFGDFCIIARPRDQSLADAYFRLVRESVNLTAIVEECDRYCSPWNIQPDLNWSINYGRQFGQTVIGCARRPAGVHRTWTANADWVVAHQVQEPADVRYLQSIRGFDPDELHNLPEFEWAMAGTSLINF
jgi:hypothetical protein